MTLQSGTEPIDQAEEAKITKYGQTCAANELDFIPFGMSTYGGYGHSALNTLKAVTRRVTARSTLPLSVIATNMHHQFAVGLAKSIASSIIARDPCPMPPLIPPLPKNNTATPTPAPPPVSFKNSNFFVPRLPMIYDVLENVSISEIFFHKINNLAEGKNYVTLCSVKNLFHY